VSDATGISLELTPESKQLLENWGREKLFTYGLVMKSWLDSMGAWMLRETLRAFDESQQTGGTRWRPNAGTYAMWKQYLGQNKPGILTGALRRSISQQIDEASARVGSPLSYATEFAHGISGSRQFVAHGPGGHTGGPFRISGSPPRPFLPNADLTSRHGATLFTQLLRTKGGVA